MVVDDSRAVRGPLNGRVLYNLGMQTNPDRMTDGDLDPIAHEAAPDASIDPRERRARRRDAARTRAIAHSTQGEKLIRMLSDDPADINGYGHGGERTRDLATTLAGTVTNGIFLHQRRLGHRSTEDPIDLIAVVPSGVWVIDIQSCAGGRVEVAGRRRAMSSRYTHLLIRGRDRTSYLDRLSGQALAVEEMLAELGRPDVPVHPVFCFFDADPQWRRTPRLGQALLTTPRRLTSLLQRSNRQLSDIEVSAIAQALAKHLPRQYLRN